MVSVLCVPWLADAKDNMPLATHASSGMVAAASGAGFAAEATEGFFVWEIGALDVELGVALVAVVGRVVVDLVDEASDVRGVVFVVDVSAAERDVKGRFAAVVPEGAMVDLRSDAAVLPGEDLVAAVEDSVVLRAAGLLFSSPDVMDDSSGSASDVVGLEVKPVLLAAVPGAGRVGGLFKLDPAVLLRIVEVPRGLDAVVEARAVVEDAAVGRRAPTVAVPPGGGRRGGTLSVFAVAEDVDEAILRRAEGDEGVEGVVELFF